MSVLKRIGIPIVEHCNLKCKGCLHFCNSNQEEFYYDCEEFERDVMRLSELFDNIEVLILYGGEPLLHPKIIRLLEIVRVYLKKTKNVGKDEIELSGYIGENISQIDQNIKFTIENEVDAGKFKQNDNVCFACHKDDSIREIDITGNGGYMLYGIKYNMDVDSVRTILSKSDIWTIQNDQTDTIFCKDKSNTYYFDIYLENGSVKSLSLHSADSYCGYNHAE